MRYRPFGRSGSAVSNLTLSVGQAMLSRGREKALELLYSALESGINSYRLETADPVVAEVLGEALSHVERKLVCVTLTLGLGDGRSGQGDFSAEGMTGAIDKVLHFSSLGWLDVAVLHEPGEQDLSQNSLNALKALRATGRVKLLGVAGDAEVMDAYVSTGAFDVLVTPSNIHSNWQVRARIRTAREQDMAIFAYDYYPAGLHGQADPVEVSTRKRGLFGLGGGAAVKPLPAAYDAFAFLHHTRNWSAEAICLAHALTDPSLTSVIVGAGDAERLAELAATPEREMPPGLAAQIEMARLDPAG